MNKLNIERILWPSYIVIDVYSNVFIAYPIRIVLYSLISAASIG